MSVTLTTLSDGTSAVNHTMALIGRDRSSAEWQDSDHVANGRDMRLFIKQTMMPTSPLGKAVRRSLCQLRCRVPVTTTIAGTSKEILEEITVNFTITTPTTISTNFAANELRDLTGVMKSLLTDAILVQILRGEV